MKLVHLVGFVIRIHFMYQSHGVRAILREQYSVKSEKHSSINVANTTWLSRMLLGNTQISNAISECDFSLLLFPKRKKTFCVRL